MNSMCMYFICLYWKESKLELAKRVLVYDQSETIGDLHQ